jgi:hypothetical protein
MGQRLHIAMAVLAAVGTVSCGGLDNAPFRAGTVHGQLSESDPSVAYVSVIGAPDVRSGMEPDGSFTLEQVPAGATELFIIAAANRALRQPLVVQGGQSISVGLLVPIEASFLSVRVRAPDHQRVVSGQVSVAGTPVRDQPLDDSGRLKIGPLPDGCYTLSISVPGFPDLDSETCVSAGEEKEVKVTLPTPASGCSETGCSDDFLCTQAGRCVECLEDSHCGPGLSCNNSRCEGGPLCTPCDGDWKCRAGATCQELPEGGKGCVAGCATSGKCKDGFTCTNSRCLPDASQYSGCGAYRSVGAPCTGDELCTGLGLANGVCLDGICTFRCTTNDECPDDYACAAGSSGRACRPEDEP